jgi:uncharacterized protein (TIGR03435 family)
MKSKVLSAVIVLMLYNISFSQSVLKVGDLAPDISITDYIANIPKDKSFKNKFILLEFWATWCGPCVQEVPNLNKMQEKFKSKKDLVFISITDEKPEKVLRTLKRIPFNSIVVSDQTKKTRKSFIENQEGDYAIPATILIDNKGIVKWIGTPFELDEGMLDKFINGKELKGTDNTISNSLLPPDPVYSKPNEEKIQDFAYKTIDNEVCQYSFTVLDRVEKQSKYNFIDLKDNGVGYYVNTPLNSIISDLVNVPEFQIILPENLKEKEYCLFYKNKSFKNEKKAKMDMKENLLKLLHLSESTVFNKVEVYVLNVKNKSKLEEVKDEGDVGDHSNKTHFIFSSIDLNGLRNKISVFYKIIIKDKTNLNGKYDFILKSNSLEDTIKELEVYGLTLDKSNEEVQFYKYDNITEN